MAEYTRRWMEIGEFQGNIHWPEGESPKEMQQFRQEAMKYLLSDGALHWRQKTNELPAKVLAST